MAAKDITQLAPADSFDEGDLLLIRKTGAGADRNINYSKFIDSISSLSVHGFNARASEGEDDKITVTTSNGIVFSRYYDGMKIFFFAPTDSDNPQIRVGNLPYKDILKYDSEESIDLKKSKYIEAIYVGDSENGKFFQTNQYIIPANTDITHQEPAPLAPLPIPAPHPIPLPPLVPLPDDIWDPSYGGNPDDPANAENPDSLDSRGNRIFDPKVLKVGNSGDFATITDAIFDLTERLGANGNGKNHAILILNDYDQEKFQYFYSGSTDMNRDLSWISIFSENNRIVTFIPTSSGTSSISWDNKKNPILNFKMRRAGRDTDHINCFFVFRHHTEVIFGRNAEIYFETPDVGKGSGIIWSWGTGINITITAKYGLKINSPYPLFYQAHSYKLLLNKAVFEHIGKEDFIINNDPQTTNYSIEMYNSEIKFKHKNDNANFGAFNLRAKLNNNNTVYMRNVKCTDRSGKMIGIITNNSTAKLENCNFAAPNTSGYDIMVDGDTGNNTITLKGTKGTTNQPKNTATAKGNILTTQEDEIVTVGVDGQYWSINEAITNLEKEFLGGNRKVTIQLLSGHVIKEQIFIENKDLSWITLISEDEEVKLDVSYIKNCREHIIYTPYLGTCYYYSFLFIRNATSINFGIKIAQASIPTSYRHEIITLINSKIALLNSNFRDFFCERLISGRNSTINSTNTFFMGSEKLVQEHHRDVACVCMYLDNDCIVNIDGGSIDENFAIGLQLENVRGTIDNFTVGNPNITHYSEEYRCIRALAVEQCSIKFTNFNILSYRQGIHSQKSNMTLSHSNIIGCYIPLNSHGQNTFSISSSNIEQMLNGNRPFGASSAAISSHSDTKFEIIDSTIKGNQLQVIELHNCKSSISTNCRVIAATSEEKKQQGIVVYGGSHIINGGDYRSENGKSSDINIIAYGKETSIKLINNPLGGFSEVSGGKIIRG